MNWEAKILREWVHEIGGAMQVHAQLYDADVPEGDVHEWEHTYSREWVAARSKPQVRIDITQDISNEAQSLASAGARIDYFKGLIPEDGLILDLDVT